MALPRTCVIMIDGDQKILSRTALLIPHVTFPYDMSLGSSLANVLKRAQDYPEETFQLQCSFSLDAEPVFPGTEKFKFCKLGFELNIVVPPVRSGILILPAFAGSINGCSNDQEFKLTLDKDNNWWISILLFAGTRVQVKALDNSMGVFYSEGIEV